MALPCAWLQLSHECCRPLGWPGASFARTRSSVCFRGQVEARVHGQIVFLDGESLSVKAAKLDERSSLSHSPADLSRLAASCEDTAERDRRRVVPAPRAVLCVDSAAARCDWPPRRIAQQRLCPCHICTGTRHCVGIPRSADDEDNRTARGRGAIPRTHSSDGICRRCSARLGAMAWVGGWQGCAAHKGWV